MSIAFDTHADKTIPLLMVKNEEFWIAEILRPLSAVFKHILLGDTGSNDRTVDIAAEFPNVEIILYGPQKPPGLGQVRYRMAQYGRNLGYTHALLVDGDQLYNQETLRWVLSQSWPDGRFLGFVTMLSLDRDENGDLWEMADLFSYPPLYLLNEKWHGDYPFEVPDAFDHSELYRYFEAPPEYRYHAVHLHRLRRSPRDDTVFGRVDKQQSFSMQKRDIPRTQRFDFKHWTTR